MRKLFWALVSSSLVCLAPLAQADEPVRWKTTWTLYITPKVGPELVQELSSAGGEIALPNPSGWVCRHEPPDYSDSENVVRYLICQNVDMVATGIACARRSRTVQYGALKLFVQDPTELIFNKTHTLVLKCSTQPE